MADVVGARGKQRSAEKEAFWRGAVARQRASGLTVRAFCERERLVETSFHFWRRELMRRDGEAIDGSAAKVADPSPARSAAATLSSAVKASSASTAGASASGSAGTASSKSRAAASKRGSPTRFIELAIDDRPSASARRDDDRGAPAVCVSPPAGSTPSNAGAPSASSIEIVLPHARIAVAPGFDPATLAAVLDAMERRRC
jgi:hypothetical protein